MREKIEKVLSEIRPFLQADGGDIDLVDVGETGKVTVKLRGACGGCAMSAMTMQMVIERYIKEEVPQVTEVVAV